MLTQKQEVNQLGSMHMQKPAGITEHQQFIVQINQENPSEFFFTHENRR